MKSTNVIDKLTEDFRASGYANAEVEFPVGMPKNNTIIDLKSTDKNRYDFLPSSTSIPASTNGMLSIGSNYPTLSRVKLPQTFTVEDLKFFIRRWEKPPTKAHKNNKASIELTSPSSFSEEFTTALGEENTSNIQGIDDEHLQNMIFLGFLEKEAVRQYANKKNKTLENISLIKLSGKNVSAHVESNTLHWSIGYNEMKGVGFVALIQTLLTIPLMDAAATLANILNVDIENLFSVFKVDARVAESRYEECSESNIFQYINIRGLPPEKSTMLLIEKIAIYGHSKQIIGAILAYRLGNNTFYIVATVIRRQLFTGKHKVSAFFLNQNKIDENLNCTIIICQDPRLAIALDKEIQDSRKINDSEFVVTGHIGTDLSVLPWNYFYGHKVILVCALSKQSFSTVKAYKEYCEQANVVDFKVYPYSILHTAPPAENSTKPFKLDSVEEELYQKKTILSSVESISGMIDKIEQEAMSYETFMEWGKNNKLFKGKELASSCQNDKVDPLFNISGSPKPVVEIFDDVLFEDIFLTPNITMVHGAKDAAKSLFGLGVLKGASTGETTFGFTMEQHAVKGLDVDGETSKNLLGSRIHQLEIQDNKNANFISKLSSTDNLWSNFDLSNKEHRETLGKYVLDNNYKYLALDNLTCLIGTGNMYTADTARTIMDWADTLTRKDVPVTFFHHTLETGKSEVQGNKMRGSEEWRIRCKIEIHLINKHGISAMKSLPQELHDLSKKDGATIGMYFKSCKVCPCVTDKTVWLHLGLGSSEWKRICVTEKDGCLVSSSKDTPHTEIDPSITVSNIADDNQTDAISKTSLRPEELSSEDVSDLSEKEQKVFSMSKEKGRFKREDVDQLLGCKPSTSQNVLNSLIAKGKINKDGTGRGTTYFAT